jgi:hypothetical protein
MDSIFSDPRQDVQQPIAIGLKAAAKLLSVGVTWLRQETINGNVPHTKLGNRYKYCPVELRQWFAGLLRKPA